MAAATTKERIHTYLVLKGGGQAERVIVWDSQDVSVGRSSENDIAIDDAALSRKHAQFYRADGAWAIKDLGTSNGTTVNGETVHTRVLQNKDVVRFGDIEISFVQVAKNPGQIGKKVEFASQLKSFGGAAGQASNGEATMLGLVQTLDGDDEEDEFVVGKMNDFGADLAAMQAPAQRQAPRPAPRDLDLELGSLGGDGLDVVEPGGDALPPPKPSPISPAHRIPAAAKPAPRPAPARPAAPEWSLDDAPPAAPAPAARPQPRPAARAAAPAPARPAAAPAKQSVSLQLEIEGLSGDLRQAVEALLGKVIELPPLRIRVKQDDL
ncbi:MAG TPA: FHA domain-containing protein [Myxococcota bacterium]|jgi:predicted component of type VI protein secretion system